MLSFFSNENILLLRTEDIQTCRRLNHVSIYTQVLYYNTLLYISLFSGDVFYCRHQKNDAVAFELNNKIGVGFAQDVLVHDIHGILAKFRFVLI